jgi:hypothetical protein
MIDVFYVGLLVGLIVGGSMGFMIMALCAVSKESDKKVLDKTEK